MKHALRLAAAAAAAVLLSGCVPPVVYSDGDYIIRGWVPAGATVFEDGSWRTPYGMSGCIPTAICQGTVDYNKENSS